MNIDIRMHQGQGLSQQLNLAPQLLNWLKLLQCPTTELGNMVARELDSNPALEHDTPEPVDTSEMVQRDEAPDLSADDDFRAKVDFLSEVENEWRYDSRQAQSLNGPSREDALLKHQYLMDSLVGGQSLQEHLLQQAAALDMDGTDLELANLLIGSIDERGYLETSVEELAECAGVKANQLERVLAEVQTLDPAGVGARDLPECLLLQVDPGTETGALARRLIAEHIEALAGQDFDAMAEACGVDVSLIFDAAALIAGLDPTPGSSFNTPPVEYVTPDITIRHGNEGWAIELNDEHIPHLRLSPACADFLKQKSLSAGDRSYIREKLRAASFLIQGIGQRQDTLRKVTQEILRVQHAYFEEANGQLKPLTMAKVASVIGVHETTVSRALANKYIQTPRGIFEMKYFFKSGYLCNDGTALTPEAVKERIRTMIAREQVTAPLTDLDIVEQFERDGLHLARRTVAKYRDELNIPASKTRKKQAQTKEAKVVRISEAITARRPSVRRTPALAFAG